MLRKKWKEILIASLCLVGVIVTVALYSTSVSKYVFNESSSHLDEIASQANDKFVKTVDTDRQLLLSWRHYINTVIDEINGGDASKETELNSFFNLQIDTFGLTDIFFIGDNETLDNDSSDDFSYIVESRKFNKEVKNGVANLRLRRSMNAMLEDSKVGVLVRDEDGKEIMLFAVKYDEHNHDDSHTLTYKGFSYKAFGIGFDADAMRESLSIEAFGGEAFCYIVRSSGHVVLQSSYLHGKDNPIRNYLDFLGDKRSADLNGNSIDKIRKDWSIDNPADSNGYTQRSDTILFKDKTTNITYYLTYRPTGFDDWMFVSLVPDTVLNKSFNSFRTQTALAMVAIMVLVVVGIIVILVTITKSKREMQQKENEIKSRDNLFDLLTYNSNDIFVLFTPNDYVGKYVSPNITEVLGFELEEIANDIHSILRAFSDDSITFTAEKLKDLPKGLTWETDTELHNIKTREKYWFHLSLYHAVYNREDSFILMLSDRTKEHQMSASLEESLKITKSANEAKSNFLANMSHDIRTPMNAIIGYTMLLAKDADKADKVREYVKKISFSSQHLLSLINDILDMSKIESGKTTLNSEKFDLPQLFEELYTMMAPQAKAKDQQFTITTKGCLPTSICADKLRINQVLINLLSNSIKYTPAGGHIELNVESCEEKIPNHAHLKITVKDDGIGMSKEFTKVIFEPFSREISVRNKNIHGTGLGMAITKNIVDLMGGTISVESELDKGSTFTVELELAIGEKEQLQDTEFWNKYHITKILVVDNDEDICLNVQALMSESNVKIDYALSGKDALELAGKAKEENAEYDIILLDWKMPEMDGIETAKRLRDDIKISSPIMVLTSYNFDEIEDEARSVGIDVFLSKPFFVSNFRNAIEKVTNTETGTEIKSTEISLDGLNILAAEDNEINAEILVDLLDMEGVKCEIACNGQEVLEKFEQSEPGKYDLIFMDIQMPVMNGYEAARAIRECSHSEAATIPIIAMTANAFEDDVKAALDAGMNAHLAKPINMDKVKLVVNNVLKERNANKLK